MSAQKIRVIVCSDCNEPVQKTGWVYFGKKSQTQTQHLTQIQADKKDFRMLSEMQGTSYT